jgi:xanthine dehydrogenase YagT iron-sulfur-binding subunit
MTPNPEPAYACPYCSERFSTFDTLRDHIFDRHAGEALPRPAGQIKLTVNGEEYELQVEPNTTLQEVIHDRLGFTGVKLFCDRGACGACTVIADNRPQLSCMMLAIECDGMHIETAEGIAASGHPLIDSYVRHHCMQCGFCTPGFVTTAKALLDKNSDPSEDEIREALSGNLCRCGTYQQHPKAVMDAAKLLRKEGQQHGC